MTSHTIKSSGEYDLDAFMKHMEWPEAQDDIEKENCIVVLGIQEIDTAIDTFLADTDNFNYKKVAILNGLLAMLFNAAPTLPIKMAVLSNLFTGLLKIVKEAETAKKDHLGVFTEALERTLRAEQRERDEQH